MVVYRLFLLYRFGLLGAAVLVVPSLQPLLFDPIGLAPASSLYRLATLWLCLIATAFWLRTRPGRAA